MEQRKLTDRKKIRLLFTLCFLTYFSTYLGRLNYSASLAEMIRTEGFSRGMAGLIGTGFFCTYGIGQLVSGFLGDRLNAKWMVFGGLLVSGTMNCIIGFLHTTPAMTAVWCLNGMAQAFIWSPLLHIMCELLDSQTRVKFCLSINYSVPLGTVTSYGLSAVMIGRLGWRAAFWLPGMLVTAMAVFWLAGMRRFYTALQRAGCGEILKEQTDCGEGLKVQPDRREGEKEQPRNISMDKIFLSSGLLFLTVALCIQGALKDGVTAWIPAYLQETHNIGSTASLLGTMVIPICNLLGVSLASFVDRRLAGNEVLSASVFFGTCGTALAVLLCWGERSVALALGMLALATTSMMAVNTLLIAVLPSRFGRLGKASEVSGILNSCVYAGCALSTYGIGALSEARGWNVTILLWSAGAFAALGICLGISGRWKAYTGKTL